MGEYLGVVIIMGVILIFCDVFFIILGRNYMRSKTPLGFYTYEKPPKPEEITDVEAWNKKHGIGMFVFAGLLTAGMLVMLLPWSVPGLIIGAVLIIGGIVWLILNHKHLEKLYRIKKEN